MIEARILKGNGDERAERRKNALVFLRKRVGLGRFEIEQPDEAVLQQKRNDEFRANAAAGLAVNVARLKVHVRYANGSTRGGRRSGDAFAERDAEARGDRVLVMEGEYAFEKLCSLVPEHDGEDVIVDELFDVLGDAAKEGVAVENGGEFAADIVEKRECFGLIGIREKQRRRHRFGSGETGGGREFCGLFHWPGTLWAIVT